ncbi:MAG: hypothetical protein K6U80_03775 [Firmicutes bacterium]|nr:hypothetical protein [Bacillota bacterium]
MRIVVTGVDGSGKSTQIQKLLAYLRDRSLSCGLIWLRWAPFLLKPVGFLTRRFVVRGQDDSLNEREVQLQSKKERLFANKFLKTAYFGLGFFDYWVTSMAKIGWAALHFRHLLFDRYFFDFVIDQSVNFNWNEEKTLQTIRSLSRFFPRVELVIYIDIAPEIAIERKNDIPNLAFLEKRINKYRYLGGKLHWAVIDGGQPVEQVAAEVIRIISQPSKGEALWQ